MIEGIPRISVRVITYKQEELIKRAINSLLAQKDYIYEICVSDDCSPDHTWDVLQQYSKDYPGLFKLNRNEKNLGIFENIEKTWSMVTGDLVFGIAGDDEAGEGWLKRVVNFIQHNKINYKDEAICIYGDYQVQYPNGDSLVRHNSAVAKYPDEALRLALRRLINNRSCCFSRNVLKKYEWISQGKSHVVETAQDRLLQLHAKKNYYIPQVGNIYYSNVGVSVHFDEQRFLERLEIDSFAEKYLESKGVQFCRVDKNQFRYHYYQKMYRRHKTLSNFLRMSVWYMISREPRYCFVKDKTRYLVFAILRRLPHKKPLCFK